MCDVVHVLYSSAGALAPQASWWVGFWARLQRRIYTGDVVKHLFVLLWASSLISPTNSSASTPPWNGRVGRQTHVVVLVQQAKAEAARLLVSVLSAHHGAARGGETCEKRIDDS